MYYLVSTTALQLVSLSQTFMVMVLNQNSVNVAAVMGVALLVILDDPRSSLLSRLLWSIASWSHHSRRPGRHHRVVAKVRFVLWSCWDCACDRGGRGTSGSGLMGPGCCGYHCSHSGAAIVPCQGGYGDPGGYSPSCFGPSLILIQILGVDCFQSRSRAEIAPFHARPRHNIGITHVTSRSGIEVILEWAHATAMGMYHCCR